MCDGPHVGKVRSRDPPWYPLTLGMIHVVAAVSIMGPSLLPYLFPFIPVPFPLFTTPDEAGWLAQVLPKPPWSEPWTACMASGLG